MLREMPNKSGAKIVTHTRYVTFQMAKVAGRGADGFYRIPDYRRSPNGYSYVGTWVHLGNVKYIALLIERAQAVSQTLNSIRENFQFTKL